MNRYKILRQSVEGDPIPEEGCGHPIEHRFKGPDGKPHWEICLKEIDECPKGGDHLWGIDGAHSNEYCKKCFMSKEDYNMMLHKKYRWKYLDLP